MADLIQVDRLQLLLVVVVPGFVSLKVWGLVNPSRRLNASDSLIEIICYSFLNFAALFWLIAEESRSQMASLIPRCDPLLQL